MSGTVKVLDPSTGKVEELSAADAQQKWVSGERQLLEGDKIPVVGPDGRTVMDAGVDTVQKALAAGWHFADSKQIATHEAEGQKLQAFVEGAGSALSLGASDLAARGLGVDRELMQARRESGAGVAGQAAGTLGSLFIPGVGEAGLAEQVGAQATKGLARTAIDAALAPMAAVSHVGNVIEKQAASALGKSIESQALARTLGSVAGRGVEGAIYGATGALSEEALGNPDSNAQSIMAALGGGALMGFGVGGALGGALSGAGEAVGAAGRAVKGAVGKRFQMTSEQASEALRAQGLDVGADNPILKKFLGMWSEDAPHALGGYDVGHIREVNSAKGQAWLKQGDQAIDESVRDLRGVVDAMTTEQEASGKAAYQNLKPAQLDKTLPKGVGNATLKSMDETLTTVRGKLQYIADNPGEFGLRPEQAKTLVEGYMGSLDDAEARMFRKAGVSRDYEETITSQVSPEVPAQRVVTKAASQEAIPAAENYVMREVQSARAPMGADDLIKSIRAVNREVTPGEVKKAIAALQEQGHLTFEGNGNKRLINLTDSGAEHTAADFRTIPEVTREVAAVPPVSRTETVARQRPLSELADKYPVDDAVVREAYDRLNKVKGLLDVPGKFGDDVAGQAQRAIRDVFRDARETLATHLEDQAVYGEAGKLQGELNRAYSARQRAWDRLQEESPLKFFADGKVDGASLTAYAKNLEKVKGDHTAQLLDDWVTSNKLFAEAVDRNFGKNVGAVERAKKLHGEFAGVSKTLGEKVSVFNALKALQNRRNAVFSFSGGGLVQSMIGGALGMTLGLPGALAGALAMPIIDPGRTALLRANTAGLVGKARDFIAKRAEQLVSGIKSAHVPALPVDRAERAVSRATIAMLNAKTADERYKAYETRLKELQSLQDPTTFGEHSARTLAGFQDAMPRHAEAMNQTATIALGLLAASLPPVRAAAAGYGPFDPMHTEPHPHDRDLRKFAQVDHILQNPLSLFDRAEHGGYLFQHELEAVQKAYPGLVEQIRAATMAAAHRAPGRLGHRTNRVVSQLLGGPAATYSRIASFQATHAAAAQAAQQPASGPTASNAGPKSKRVTGLASPTDRLESYPSVA